MKFTFPNSQTHPREPLSHWTTSTLSHLPTLSHTQSVILSILIFLFLFLFLVSLLPLYRGKVVALDFRWVSGFCSHLVLIFLFLFCSSSSSAFQCFFFYLNGPMQGLFQPESKTKKRKKVQPQMRMQPRPQLHNVFVRIRLGALAQSAHSCFLLYIKSSFFTNFTIPDDRGNCKMESSR